MAPEPIQLPKIIKQIVMKTRQAFFLIATLLVFVCCKPAPAGPAQDSGDEGNTEIETDKVAFTFSAATSKYASLKEAVFVGADNPDKETMNVEWGDGTKDSGTDASFSHKYTSAGNYTVKASLNGSEKEWEIEIGPLLALDEAVKELYASPGKVWVMTHRSHVTDHTVPENSVAAVRSAIQAGADVIETDTHRTRDGKIVISHDESLSGHTTGSGMITAKSLKELQWSHLLDRDGNVTDEPIPTLEEFLLAARGKVYVNLDYSPRTASTREVLDVVESLGMVQQVFMFCKNAAFVKEVLDNNVEANAYVDSSDWESLMEGPKQYFLQVGWNSGQTRNSECVIRCHTAYESGVLCSVNLLHVNHDYIPEYEIDESQLSSLFELYPECQMVHTDCPQEMVAILKEQGRR